MNKGIWLVLALGAACSASDSNGTINVTWAVTVNGAASTCADVGGDGVEIVTVSSSGRSVRDLFDCDDFSGRITRAAGTYDLFAYVIDANENRLTTQDQGAEVIVAEDQVTPVGVIEFAFELGFRVHMGSSSVTGGNCNPSNPNNGAGVAVEEVRITSATQCMAFTIRGVTDENDQLMTAPTCQPFICQLETTVHTVSGLPAGQYRIQVLGYKGATSTARSICYISNQMNFTAVGGNVPNLGTIFAPFDDSQDTLQLCNATKPQD